jgi:ADP-ribose pyrophosphatase YjhB (NUDIX family)
MDLRVALQVLDAAIGDPRNGLPEEVFLFLSRTTPLPNVDLLIQDEQGRTLLTWRDDEVYGAGWHVPGGIIRFKERAADRIHAVAEQELGARIQFEPTPLGVFEGISERKIRGHFIGLLYRCRLLSPPEESRRAVSTNKACKGEWMWHNSAPANLLPDQEMYLPYF